jgi:hypothetical protein
MVSALAEVRRGATTREPEQNLERLRAALEPRGLLLHVHSSQSTGRVQGYSIGLRGEDGQPATFSDGREAVWKASALGFRGRKALDAQVRLPERLTPEQSETRTQTQPPKPPLRRGGPER